MSASSVQRGKFAREPGEFGEVGELSSMPVARVVRTGLLPGELRASLPALKSELVGPVAALTRFLGPMLTAANPLWSGDPLPRLRSLQKSLLSHSMGLPQASRTPVMDAISVVESAVQLRLRWQQMRSSEAELALGSRAAPEPEPLPAGREDVPGPRRILSERSVPVCDDKVAALGLIWGHLNCAHYAPAASLAQACLGVWPDDMRLRLAAALATVELGQPPDAATRNFLLNAGANESAALVLRRSGASRPL